MCLAVRLLVTVFVHVGETFTSIKPCAVKHHLKTALHNRRMNSDDRRLKASQQQNNKTKHEREGEI
jgi:hypothetical protein